MSIGTVLLIVLILLPVGALPSWPHSRSWGYYPSGGLSAVPAPILDTSSWTALIPYSPFE